MTTTTPAEQLSASRTEFESVTASFPPEVKQQLAQTMLHIQHETAAEVPRVIAQQIYMYRETIGRVVAGLPQDDQQRVVNMMANAQLAAVATVCAALSELTFSDPKPAPVGAIADKLFEVNARIAQELLPPV